MDENNTPIKSKVGSFFVEVSSFKNTNNQMEFVKANSPDDRKIDFLEFREESFLVTAPKVACRMDQLLTLELQIEWDDGEMELNVCGKVMGIHPISDKVNEVEIKLTQVELEIWEKLLLMFGDRSEKVTEVFEAIRGY